MTKAERYRLANNACELSPDIKNYTADRYGHLIGCLTGDGRCELTSSTYDAAEAIQLAHWILETFEKEE